MPLTETISVALTREMSSLVQAAVDTGVYASSSEVVGEALSEWSHKRLLQQNGVQDIRRLWQEARANNEPGLPSGEVLNRLERKYQAKADAGR